jgi:hypothetical protein
LWDGELKRPHIPEHVDERKKFSSRHQKIGNVTLYGLLRDSVYKTHNRAAASDNQSENKKKFHVFVSFVLL